MRLTLIAVVLLVSTHATAVADAGPLRKLASRGKSVLGSVVKCVGGCR